MPEVPAHEQETPHTTAFWIANSAIDKLADAPSAAELRAMDDEAIVELADRHTRLSARLICQQAIEGDKTAYMYDFPILNAIGVVSIKASQEAVDQARLLGAGDELIDATATKSPLGMVLVPAALLREARSAINC
jgi:hypothetical protein